MKRYSWQRNLEDTTSEPSPGQALAAQLCLAKFTISRMEMLANAERYSRGVAALGTWAIVAGVASLETADAAIKSTRSEIEQWLPKSLDLIPDFLRDLPDEWRFRNMRVAPDTQKPWVMLTPQSENDESFYEYQADIDRGVAIRVDYSYDQEPIFGNVGLSEIEKLASLGFTGIDRPSVQSERSYRRHLAEAGQSIQMPGFTLVQQDPPVLKFTGR